MSIGTLEGTLHRGCGGHYEVREESATIRISGMSAVVNRASYCCDKCGHERNTIDQREAAEKAAVAAMRAAHSLLGPREIRSIRESAGLTVTQFSELCYGTPKGIIEGWEKGRYLQNREADALIRSLADRDTLRTRAQKVGVVLPESLEPAAQQGSGVASDIAVHAVGDVASQSDAEVSPQTEPQSQS